MIIIDNYDGMYLFSWLEDIASNFNSEERILIEPSMWIDETDEDFLREFIGYEFEIDLLTGISPKVKIKDTTEIPYLIRLWNPKGELTSIRAEKSARNGWSSIENLKIK